MATWSDKIYELLSSLEQGNLPAQMTDRINRAGAYAAGRSQTPAPSPAAAQPAVPEASAEAVNPAVPAPGETAAAPAASAGSGAGFLLPELTPRELMQSVIMSEILGKPVSRRRYRRG